MKSSFYLKHDLDAREDDKMRAMMMKHGARGYGIYWLMAEDLYRSNGRIARDYAAMAWAYHEQASLIKSVAEDFGLFTDAHGKIACARVDRDLNSRRDASEKASIAGKASQAKQALNKRSTTVKPGEERTGEERTGEERIGEDKTAAPSAADLSKKLSTTVDKLCKTTAPEANLETQLPFSFGDIPKGRRVIDIDPTSCRAILDKAARLGLDLRRALEARIALKNSELHAKLRTA